MKMEKINSDIADSFCNFLVCLQDTNKNNLPEDIGFQIFYDLFKIREAQREYKINFCRKIDYSLSDIFQDIIAHYLKKILPKEYEVILEYKQKKLRPDILIKKNGKNHAILEIKTTIGWNRDLVKEENYLIRLKKLSDEFGVPIHKVFYIFEASRNVNNEFADIFKNDKPNRIKEFIFPLFEFNANPSFCSKRSESLKKFSNEEIYDFYKKDKITDFKEILNKVKSI